MTPAEIYAQAGSGAAACPELVFAGDPLLRRRATYVAAQDAAESIFAKLRDALSRYRAATGVGRGLAAPQIGIGSRAFVTFLGDEWRHYLNPMILGRGDERVLYRESCLSCGPVSADVCRPASIEVQWNTERGQTRRATLSGIEARVFQHELDHLDGVLCVDVAEAGSINLRTENPLAEKFRPAP